MTVLITLSIAGTDSGPYDLYSSPNGVTFTLFATGIAKSALLAGYTSYVVPDGSTVIRVMSTGVCTNYIDLTITGGTTTTTSSTTAAPTTTTTTTPAVGPTTTTTTTNATPAITCYTLASSNSNANGCYDSESGFYLINDYINWTITLRDQYGTPIITPTNVVFTVGYDFNIVQDCSGCSSSGSSSFNITILAGTSSTGPYQIYTKEYYSCDQSGICNGTCYAEQSNITILSVTGSLPACP